MRGKVVFISVVLIFSACAVSAQEKQINFSGEWILDADKSELGDGRGGRRRGRAASKMIVTQGENKLGVESFRQNRDGEEVSTLSTYTLDGEECENERFNRTSISTAEWSEDGKELLIYTEMTFSRGDQEFTMESDATWTLVDGEFVIETTRSTPMGERNSKAVYTKKVNEE